MQIEINPNLVDLLNTTAAGQGLTPERFVEHHIEKHLVANLRIQTAEKLKELSVNEVAEIKVNVEAVIEAKRQPEFITPTEQLPTELIK